MSQCDFPNCPSGTNIKLLDERHEEVKNHLVKIESGQERMIATMTSVAALTADVINIKTDIADNKSEHDEIFSRLRAVEVGKEDRQDAKDTRSAAISWAWDIAKMVIVAALAVAGVKLF